MRPGQIRPLALAVIWRGDELLVGEFHSEEQGIFYRLLGGTIEYGEHGQEALRREFREELETELTDVRYLTTLENIFTYREQVGHEIVLLYEATMSNQAFYEQDTLVVHEEDGTQTARWMSLSAFDDGAPLYPNGLPEFLTDKRTEVHGEKPGSPIASDGDERQSGGFGGRSPCASKARA